MDTAAISGAGGVSTGFLPNAPAIATRPSIPVGQDPADSILQKPDSPVQTDTQSGRALEVFRKELMVSGSAASKPYCDCADYKPVLTADDVASAALDGAKQSVSSNADVSSFALLRFRQRVQSAATVTQQSVGNDADIDEVGKAVDKIESGLESLDADAARNVESSASVLAIDSRQRQRSTIRIRTQEGDVVRLDIKRASQLSARDVAVSDENGEASRTEVSASSRSRLNFTVRGDLNEAEFAAIQSVFAQAESIAGEFFDGDLGAAFSQASGFEFDAGQLARVNLRFRSSEITNTSYAQTVTRAPAPAVSAPAAPQPADRPAVVSNPAPAATDAKAEPVVAAPVEPEVVVTEPAPVVEQVPVEFGGNGGLDLGSDTFLRFFDLLGDFLRGVADGFERAAGGKGEAADAASFKFHFSQSFKLQVFKSVLQVAAPDEPAEDATNLASALIDALPDGPVPSDPTDGESS